MKSTILLPLFLLLIILLVSIFRRRNPLASHDAYMQMEYGQAYLDAAFLKVEIGIDKILLEIENR